MLKNKKVFLSIDGKSSLSACATTPAESTPDASASRPPSRKRSPRRYARVSPKFHHAKFLLFESRTHSQRISVGERPWTHVYKNVFQAARYSEVMSQRVRDSACRKTEILKNLLIRFRDIAPCPSLHPLPRFLRQLSVTCRFPYRLGDTLGVFRSAKNRPSPSNFP